MTGTKLRAGAPVFVALGARVAPGTHEGVSDKYGVRVRLAAGGLLFVPFVLCHATEAGALRALADALQAKADDLRARAAALEAT